MKKVFILILILSLALTTVIFASPGDTTDPIVVLSYLNDRLTALIDDYNLENIENMQVQIDKLSSSEGSTSEVGQTLEIVEVNAGEKLIAGAGTELILRQGEANVIGSELGGISNITMGKEFVSGMAVVPNNLMIVPRDDGRGVYAENFALFMVRGTYEIIK
ncbi:MAG: hypothetical protein SA378_04005 [Sedimentibacter sp.]|uniref:hypothetical protein n=1 Tax=Sedimentibacter sp. TaxID=1960295 RepID=UPI002981A9A9|nr:hypothetical protein [Sedimentibacter sp.]MDW5299286.1 hypothetical protein [Sedimentibacter sp.]